MFSDQTEQQAREDFETLGEHRYDICGWPGCGVHVKPDIDEFCPAHEREADEDAMNDMLDAARKYPRRVIGSIMGHLAASGLSREDYLSAGRLLQTCSFLTHFREPK